MGAAKWIAGILGWVSWGPIGGLIGYLLGSAIERQFESVKQLYSGEQSSSGQGTPPRQGGGQRRYTQTEQRNSFFVSLLVLSSAVIRADGKVLASELGYVRDFIRRNFGESAVNEAMRILQGLNAQEINIYSVGEQIASNMNYSQRLQLFHYLTQIAIADKEFSKTEKGVLEAIATAIRLTSSDASSIIAMFYKETDSAYTVLEISPSATDDEVRSAYRRMAMKYHPDRVSTLGEDVQKAAAEKFRQVKEAYETIKKERGLN